MIGWDIGIQETFSNLNRHTGGKDYRLWILIDYKRSEEVIHQCMPENLSIFRTPASQAKYMASYDAVLALWPVPYESFDVPTRFGKTHVIASGPKEAQPLVLLHATSASATMWFPNIADLSREFRVYALDIIGDAGKSVVSHLPQNKV
jgi:hypothetical protein